MREQINQLVDTIQTICADGLGATLMEVCGTHTVALFRTGVKRMLPESIRLISGPGCPVCVTSQGFIDTAGELAGREDVTVCTYGDMVRVPGRSGSLENHRGRGARVVVVYSARDAVKYAAEHGDREVVFLAVGFETTAPATAATILEAQQRGLSNFSVLSSHKLVVPAMTTLLTAEGSAIEGFLCPGHVSVVIGSEAYRPIVERFAVPCVVAGFEPVSMLRGVEHLLRQRAEGRADVENVYPGVVHAQGNPQARELIEGVFTIGPATWRAMGEIPDSGLLLRPEFEPFDAERRFGLTIGPDYEPEGCRCGEVIQGKLDPNRCALFGSVCTPMHPIGPCMVSSEGACSAWYKYRA